MGVYPLGNVPKEINNRFGRYSWGCISKAYS
jgi:hypothetical protein